MVTYCEEVGGSGAGELSEGLLCAPGCCLEDKFVSWWQSFGQIQWSESDFLGLVLVMFQFLKNKAFNSVHLVQGYSIFAAS